MALRKFNLLSTRFTEGRCYARGLRSHQIPAVAAAAAMIDLLWGLQNGGRAASVIWEIYLVVARVRHRRARKKGGPSPKSSDGPD